MSNIKVYILNFHRIFSHIEILLENTSVQPHEYYIINRWDDYIPNDWCPSRNYSKYHADSIYSFDIEACPEEIVQKWKEYHQNTADNASIFGNNCAVAVQWFLTEFAGIPEPSLLNVSWNHLALGIIWPSFIPCPVTLPGRIMSNAKFYIEAKNNHQLINEYGSLFIYTKMALATLMFATSVFAITVAASILTGGILAGVITGCVAISLTSTYGFFRAHNLLSAQKISTEMKKNDPHFNKVVCLN